MCYLVLRCLLAFLVWDLIPLSLLAHALAASSLLRQAQAWVRVLRAPPPCVAEARKRYGLREAFNELRIAKMLAYDRIRWDLLAKTPTARLLAADRERRERRR